MKGKRLFILIYAMLICVASVGCSHDISEPEAKTSEDIPENYEDEAKIEAKAIKASIVVKYSEKEIFVFSNANCFFRLAVEAIDEGCTVKNTYGSFQISEGETIRFTLEDLAPGFFSDETIIYNADSVSSFVYEDSPLETENYELIYSSPMLKYSNKEITVYSDETCFFDLLIYTEDTDFKSFNFYRRIKISEGETITLTLEDLAPGFFSDTTIIRSCSHYESYVEKK